MSLRSSIASRPLAGRRSGTALVLALILLVALLLLGLPFLFSQSASLSGTRAFSDSRLAQIGRDNAANLAAAVAAYAIGPALTAAPPSAETIPPSWSSLPDDLSASSSAPAILQIGSATDGVQAVPSSSQNPDDTDGSLAVVPSNLLPVPTANPNQNQQAVYLGATISDESGKLDPNTMGPLLWQNLLGAAGISDWDDNAVYQGGQLPAYQNDPDNYGQLAQALAYLRSSLPNRRITDLDQLLGANPQTPFGQPGGPAPFAKLRWPLTRTELERLRPVLSLHNPRLGRNGLIDLGSVVQIDNITGNDTDWLDSNPDPHLPERLNPAGSGPFTTVVQFTTVVPAVLLAEGTTVVSENTSLPSGAHMTGMVNDWNGMGETNSHWTGANAHLVLGEPIYLQGGILAAQAGQALMIDAPAPLNIHQLSYLVRQTLGTGTFPAANDQNDPLKPGVLPKPIGTVADPGVVTTIGSTFGATSRSSGQTGMNFVQSRPSPSGSFETVDLLRFVSPVYTGFEIPPLGILSGGIFAIDATATVTDVAGNQVAQSARRDLVQAVPQENLLERRWLTQGAFHTLVAGRYGSHVQAWPVPYERLTSDNSPTPLPVAPDDADPANSSVAPKAGTGLRPRPLPSFASLPNTNIFYSNSLLHPEWLYLKHLAIDWRLAFGSNASNPQQQWATVFNAEELLSEQTAAQSNLPSSITAVGCLDIGNANGPTPLNLHPDGYYRTASTSMSYALVNPFNSAGSATIPVLSSWVVTRPSANASAFTVIPQASGNSSPLANTYEMDSRHLSMWIQPQVDWNPSNEPQPIMPLWEMRMPVGNTGSQVIDASGAGPGSPWTMTNAAAGGNGWEQAGASGSNGSQNYCGLFYDVNQRLLVLAMAPPSIEHTYDDAIHVPMANLGYQLVDTLSLGDSIAPAFLSLAPAQLQQTSKLTTFTQLCEPNRVLHCYYTPDNANGPYFRKNQWYHIQVAIADDRPDGIAIIVDGIAGTDVMKVNPSSPTLTNLGDHCTLPTMALNQAISQVSIQDGNPSDTTNSPYIGSLAVSGVTLTPPNGGTSVTLTANDLLPARGVVRIDDEYFIYSSISQDGKTLQNVSRARRQDSWVVSHASPNGSLAPNYPNTESHALGALVTPGGCRVSFGPGTNQKLYSGGCTLTGPLYNGDSSLTAHYSQVWATMSGVNQLPASQVNGNFVALLPTTTSIALAAGPLNAEFPTRGWVQIRDAVSNVAYDLFYSSVSGNTLSGIMTAGAYTTVGSTTAGEAPFNPVIPATGITLNPNLPVPVVLISIGVSGPVPPTTAGMYSPGPLGGAIGDTLIAVQQLPDPANPSPEAGRVEWIHYCTIVDDAGPGAPAGGGFFIDNGYTDPNTGFVDPGGFAAPLPGIYTTDSGCRGRCRTAWAGNMSEIGASAPLGFSTQTFFSAGSAVLPVQTNSPSLGHWLNSGDVVTMLPNSPNVQPTKGLQMTVRFAATDGLPPTLGAATGWVDVKNEYFSFTSPLPALMSGPALSLSGLEFLVGDCWSGWDLSGTNNNVPQPRGYLPRLDLWTDSTNSTGTPPVPAPGRVYFGSIDLGRIPSPAPATWYASGTGSDVVIDDIVAGQLSPYALNANNGNPSTLPNVDDAYLAIGPNTNQRLPASITAIYQNGTAIPAIQAGLPNIVGVLVKANANLFPYTANGNMGLVAIDGEVFAYQVPTTADQATLQGIPGNVPFSVQQYARLVARGLLGSADVVHALPTVSAANQTPSLSAVRIPVGPVLQLQSNITMAANGTSNWFALSDQDISAGAVSTLYAPAAMIMNADGTSPEMLALIGPKIHNPAPPGGDAQLGFYCTASWIRQLYNCNASAAPTQWTISNSPPPPIVIGWWPRYASALPAVGTPLTAQHLRSRTYSWLGLPMGVEGGYFDPTRVATLQSPFTGLPLAQVDVDDAEGTFVVEARALSYREPWTSPTGNGNSTPAMDWSLQTPVLLVSTGTPVSDASAAFTPADDLAGCFSANGTYQPVDGAELRLSWCYANSPVIKNPPLDNLAAVAQAGNSAPTILDARLRCLAPIRLLATERDR